MHPIWLFLCEFKHTCAGKKTNARPFAPGQGYISGVLQENVKTTDLFLNLLVPNLAADLRLLVIRVFKLPTVAALVLADEFWLLLLDRPFFSALAAVDLARNGLAKELPRIVALLAHPDVGTLATKLGPTRREAVERYACVHGVRAYACIRMHSYAIYRARVSAGVNRAVCGATE